LAKQRKKETPIGSAMHVSTIIQPKITEKVTQKSMTDSMDNMLS